MNHLIEKNSKKLLWVGITLYTLIFSIISIWKYSNYLYNALDLAIINNVFWNSLHGSWWWSAIQGHSYLGDHFTPILILLLPIYALWQSPEILLILQSLFLSLAAWPIFKIGQLVLRENRLALGIALVWLINPLVHNINLYEFHFIALSPFFILTTFYYYLKIKEDYSKKHIIYFLVWLFLSLMIREDISAILITLLIIGLINNLRDKKIFKLMLGGLMIGVGWAILASKIIAHFSPSDFSPFFYYYSWLGNAGMGDVLRHILSLNNFEMLVGLLLPFLFIPLIKPKWLLLILIPLGVMVFSATGGGALVWQMHYSALFLPGLILAFIFSFNRANQAVGARLKSRYILMIILVVVNIYLWVDFGPIGKVEQKMLRVNQGISQGVSVLASYRVLANYSSRENIYALHYYFLGQGQFGAEEYVLEEKPEYILIDGEDMVDFNLQLKNLSWSRDYYQKGDERMRELLKDYGVVGVVDGTALFEKDFQSQISLYGVSELTDETAPYELGDKIELTDYEYLKESGQLKLVFRALEPLDKDYQLVVNKKILPMAWGLYPTSEWQVDEAVEMSYWLGELEEIKLEIVELMGGVEMDKMGTTKRVIDSRIEVGRVSLDAQR